MIIVSLISCLIIAFLLVLTANKSVEVLYVGTGAIGFFISFQFASGKFMRSVKFQKIEMKSFFIEFLCNMRIKIEKLQYNDFLRCYVKCQKSP